MYLSIYVSIHSNGHRVSTHLNQNTSLKNLITFNLTPSMCYLTISVKSYNFFISSLKMLLFVLFVAIATALEFLSNLNHSYMTKEFYYLSLTPSIWYLTVSVKSYRLIYKILIILLSVAMATAVELVPTTRPSVSNS